MREYWTNADVSRLPIVETIPGLLFYEDSQANKLGVNVYENGEPMDLDYNVHGATDHDKAGEVQRKYFSLGNVDLLNRPQVSSATMNAKGWNVPAGETATVYSCTYTAGSLGVPWSQNVIIHITPIRANGTVLTPAQLDNYIDTILTRQTVTSVLAEDNERYGLVLWIQTGITSWAAGTELAEMYDDLLHRLQAVYYLDEDVMPTETEIREFTEEASTVEAWIKRANKTTIKVAGQKSGNQAWVILPATAYTVPGHIGIYIKLLSGNNVVTLGGFETNVYK